MVADTVWIFRCQWPGGCPQDSATMIGTTSLALFHSCYTHAEQWRSMSYVEMLAVHASLAPVIKRRIGRTAGPLEHRNMTGVRDRDIGGNVYG